nr:glycosyltransferase [Deinococcus betulae]
MTRAAVTRPVYYVEEPVFSPGADRLTLRREAAGLTICTPHLRAGQSATEAQACTATLLSELVEAEDLPEYDLWVYTPMELPVADQLSPRAVIYDCMDELANFHGAAPELRVREAELFRRADVVFTGGQQLFEAKSARHANVHAFPSSVDTAHFRQARSPLAEPADQHALAGPRFGFAGVIDERLNLDLLRRLAARRPEWHFVFLGPVVKIDPATLPQGPNMHYLGMKSYAELPAYLAHWDVALLPFAHNEATAFISPTKTPEYLAAGLPVVSTSIHDVVQPYGEQGLVQIADGTAAFEAACAAALAGWGTPAAQATLQRVDLLLAQQSWDRTWAAMDAHLCALGRPGRAEWPLILAGAHN